MSWLTKLIVVLPGFWNKLLWPHWGFSINSFVFCMKFVRKLWPQNFTKYTAGEGDQVFMACTQDFLHVLPSRRPVLRHDLWRCKTQQRRCDQECTPVPKTGDHFQLSDCMWKQRGGRKKRHEAEKCISLLGAGGRHPEGRYGGTKSFSKSWQPFFKRPS